MPCFSSYFPLTPLSLAFDLHDGIMLPKKSLYAVLSSFVSSFFGSVCVGGAGYAGGAGRGAIGAAGIGAAGGVAGAATGTGATGAGPGIGAAGAGAGPGGGGAPWTG